MSTKSNHLIHKGAPRLGVRLGHIFFTKNFQSSINITCFCVLCKGTMRVLAVGNLYATYQILGVYPFEVFTHSRGHKLIGVDRLPETVYLYATKGKCIVFKELLRVLGSIVPRESLTVHYQCIIGRVWLKEISAQQAAIIAPHIPILDNASQILHITKRAEWSEPFPLFSSQRFDKWVKLDSTQKTHLQLHTARMEGADDDMTPIPKPPRCAIWDDNEVSEAEVDTDEAESNADEGKSNNAEEPVLQRHERSTRTYDFFAPGELVCANPEVMQYKGAHK